MKYALGANRNPSGRVLEEYTAAGQLPLSIITDITMLPVLNQQQTPACVGHAGANGVNYDYYVKTGSIPQSSAEFNYTVAKVIDGNTDEGTSALSMFDGWKKYMGSATVNSCPNNTQLDPITYCSITLTPAMLKDAANFPITNEVEISNPTCAQLQSLIQQYGVVLIALDVDEETWMNQDGSGLLLPGTAGGHEVLLYGYETIGNDVKFHIRNSWGNSWGQNGNGSFMWSSYQGNIYDAMSITVMTVIPPAKPSHYFSKNLSMGQTDPDVVWLQKCLNYDPQTALQAKALAPGSPGYESNYFGALTFNAVESFQKKYGIQSVGTVGPITRSELNTLFSMNINQAGLAMIEGFEGFVATPYQDAGGTWTIGYGFTYDLHGNPVTANTPAITEAEAQTWLQTIIVTYVDGVLGALQKEINQNQLNALVSFTYNLGIGAFQQSSICAKINAGETVLETDFTQYSNIKGVLSQGLVTRRQAEYNIFIS